MFRLVLLALVFVAACGFTPVYGPTGAARGLSGQIAIDPPRDETGFIFVQQLEDRLGRGTVGPYRLAANLNVVEERQGITPANESVRVHVVGTLDYRLLESGTNALLREGSITTFTAYSDPVFTRSRVTIAGNPVTVRTARRDAITRLMTILADRLTAELLATASDWRQ